ncbi:MAG: GNAT family N-acetyltransferase [Candidatus Micrarchaeota archaeon]|nr:GNAT family N-acetyltransferase [Candidatus Micrarchaeota archaeon]MDE1833866.1 GNAT family N-acetyltransferase [Candidatus Micrarchaeota archaeon]MDE1859353.1 GNAT family N-acetyltransferase [Candidatus Micrarchaeota archaeon]
MSAKIRLAEQKDFEDVLQIGRSVYDEVEEDPAFGDHIFLTMPNRQEMKKWFEKLREDMKSGDAVYAVAEIDGKVVGHCFVRRSLPVSEFAHVGTFSILVHKDHRSAGIGRQMAKFTIAKCKQKFRLLQLFVFGSNVRAKRLYRSLGFKDAGTIPKFYKRGKKYIDRDIMYMEL